MSEHIETEVAIVGAGAAGSYLARRFASAGKKVHVFEAGPPWQERDLVSSQIWARRLRWSGEAVDVAGSHRYAFNFNAGWGFGGAALHHYGLWPRMHEADFTMASDHGRGFDWPLRYDDLRPYYDAIQAEVGMSGDAAQEPWRPPGEPYPLPPLKTLTQAEVIKRGFDQLGLAVAPAPLAVLSEPYKNRAACIYDGWCDAGCPINALWNPLVFDIPEAKKHGAVFVSHAPVTRIVSEGERITGLQFVDKAGVTNTVRASQVILAGSVVNNPALLLNSATEKFPDGLANRSGTVGQYFMTHVITGIYGFFAEETEPHLGLSGAQYISHDDYEKQRTDGPFGSMQWSLAPSMKPNDLAGLATTRVDLFGAELEQFMQRAAKHLANMVCFLEELPRADNRVELSDSRDRFGNRRARVVHGFDQTTLALYEYAKAQGLKIFAAAGATDSWAGGANQAHMMGGTIMGSDPTASVADAYGRCHDHANLWLAGSGLFPTAAAVNPTFTLYALAARTADHLLAHWARYS